MKILQKEITGTQTSFLTNFGGKLSFIHLRFTEFQPTEMYLGLLSKSQMDETQFIESGYEMLKSDSIKFHY